MQIPAARRIAQAKGAARDRLTGALLALLLQAGLVALLIVSRPTVTPPERERIFYLPPLPRARQAPPAPAPPLPPMIQPESPDLAAPPVIGAPAAPGNAPPALPPLSNLKGFGRALNGCAPQDWANLTPEQRALCQRPGEGMAILQAPPLMGAPSHVKDEAHWTEELARKQSAALMPCGGFLNVACVIGKILNGTMSDYGDPSTWPRYEVQQIAPEDFYKLEKAYADWREAHPKAPGAQPVPSSEGVGVHPQ